MMNMREMKRLFNKYLKLNKRIVDEQAIAVVPGLSMANQPINDVDIEEDYIYFCFTKFTKTMIAIETLLKNELNEDALILVRSNYECLVHAKSIVKTAELIDHFTSYKLGLIDQKRFQYAKTKKGGKNRRKILDVNDPSREIKYISNISEIASAAEETISYKHIYSYLCDLTHCNIVTSGYYREMCEYSYELANKRALWNVLKWSIYFNLKFYKALIEANIFNINKIENAVLRVLSSDQIKLIGFFDDEVKRITKELSSITDETLKDKLNEHILILEILKKEIG